MSNKIIYPQGIEKALQQIHEILEEAQLDFFTNNNLLSQRTLALLILQKDQDIWHNVQVNLPNYNEIEQIIFETQQNLGKPITEAIALTRQKIAIDLENQVLQESQFDEEGIGEKLHHLMVNPVTGFPLLLLILYYGVYQFVGNFGGGTLVDLIEGFFETRINPVVNEAVKVIFPWQVLQDLFANDYGIITLGIRYATAIILPIVATYFLVFSIMEDTGYLPRLSLMLDRLFNLIGLSGRAVIPIVLGFGCDTMATVVTRTLETKRERVIATFLLALAVPCAA